MFDFVDAGAGADAVDLLLKIFSCNLVVAVEFLLLLIMLVMLFLLLLMLLLLFLCCFHCCCDCFCCE